MLLSSHRAAACRVAPHGARLVRSTPRALSSRLTGGVGDTGNGNEWDGVGVSTWDSDTQTFHAGQDWMQLTLDGTFVEDFSVTTNGFGTPQAAEEAAAKSCSLMHHYPPADFEPAITDLADFLWPNGHEEGKARLLMGNGASELIDLVIRDGPIGVWKPAGYVQSAPPPCSHACGALPLLVRSPPPRTPHHPGRPSSMSRHTRAGSTPFSTGPSSTRSTSALQRRPATCGCLPTPRARS
jgi:hypothetical protein